MTKKDYEAIAKVVKDAVHEACKPECDTALAIIIQITDDLCEVLEADNPRFDRDKFYAASNVAPL